MKKTRFIALLRNIWATKASYLSIMIFVGLGIGIFLGIKWNQPAFLNTAHGYYEDRLLHDYNIKFPFGFTEADMEALRSMEDITLVEGGYTAEGTTEIGGRNYILSMLSLTEQLNLATAKEGVLPAAVDEIGIEESMAAATGLKIGDRIAIRSDGPLGLGESYLHETEFTVTGIVEHPAYIRKSASQSRGLSTIGDGMADYYILLSPAAFDPEAYDNCYSNAYLRSDALRGLNSFGEAYKARLDEIAVTLQETGSVRGLARAEEIRARYETEMGKAEDQIAEGEQELFDAETQVADGEKRIAEAEIEIADAEAEIAAGEAEIAASREELKRGEETLSAARARYNSAKREYDGVAEKITAATGYSVDQLISMYRNASEEVKETIRGYGDVEQLIRKKNQLDAAGRELRAGERDLEGARTQIAEGEAALAEAKAELASAREELAQSRRDLEEARRKIAEGETELQHGREEVESVETSAEKLLLYEEWMLEKRTGNISFHIVEVYSEMGQKLCYSLALLFVFVGVMISYTSIARIVQEQRPLIGVQKSLGFTKGEVTRQYMAYALSAVALGGVLGGILGYFGIEAIMNGAFAKNHIIGAFVPHFSWADLLVMVAVEMVLIGLAAWMGCHKHLGQPAITLMRKGGGAKQGRTRFYEKWKWWEKRSLYTQTIVNNLMSDKTRVIATLVGVVGCTALLVMALGVQASIRNTPEKHFDRIWTYDARLLFDDRQEDMDMGPLLAVLDGEGIEYATAHKKLFFIEDEQGNWVNGDVLAPDISGNFGAFVRLMTENGEGLSVPEEGALINRTYTLYHDVRPGDTIDLMDINGNRYSVSVAGITEYYLSANQLIMSPAYYEKVMGSAPAPNAAYLKLGDADFAALQEKLSGLPGFLALHDDHAEWAATFEAHQATTMLMVSIALVLAVVMALMVLLNLNVVLINEKAVELTVMRINGFSIGATKAYIYRDNIVLTAIGILLGVGVGLLLSVYVINSLRSESIHLITDANLAACLMGAGISAAFAFLTNVIALRRINTLKVSDLSRL